MKNFEPKQYKDLLKSIYKEIEEKRYWRENTLQKILKKYPKDGRTE